MATGDEANTSDEIVLIGFPSETLNKASMRIKGRPTSIATALMRGIPSAAKPPICPTLDIFLKLTEEAIDPAGDVVSMPRIAGMSGCAIWQSRGSTNDALWTPNTGLRLVGVQSSALSGQYFRGKRWAYIQNLLEKIR